MSITDKKRISKEIQHVGSSVISLGRQIFEIGEKIEKETFYMEDDNGKSYNYKYKGENFVKDLKDLKNELERQIKSMEERVNKL